VDISETSCAKSALKCLQRKFRLIRVQLKLDQIPEGSSQNDQWNTKILVFSVASPNHWSDSLENSTVLQGHSFKIHLPSFFQIDPASEEICAKRSKVAHSIGLKLAYISPIMRIVTTELHQRLIFFLCTFRTSKVGHVTHLDKVLESCFHLLIEPAFEWNPRNGLLSGFCLHL